MMDSKKMIKLITKKLKYMLKWFEFTKYIDRKYKMIIGY